MTTLKVNQIFGCRDEEGGNIASDSCGQSQVREKLVKLSFIETDSLADAKWLTIHTRVYWSTLKCLTTMLPHHLFEITSEQFLLPCRSVFHLHILRKAAQVGRNFISPTCDHSSVNLWRSCHKIHIWVILNWDNFVCLPCLLTCVSYSWFHNTSASQRKELLLE